MTVYYPFSPAVDRLIDLALEEDLGGGDLTTDSLGLSDRSCQGVLLAKAELVIAGLGVFVRVMHRIDPEIHVTLLVSDGQAVARATHLATIEGNAASVLKAERTALNFLNHMSGVATLTNRYVRAASHTGTRICDTRKTTPGFRELDKYAVRMGGASNHRFNLGSAVMIKDNHIAAVGSIAQAVRRVKQAAPHTATIEVEVARLDQLDEAIGSGADIVLLDNMTDDEMREAVQRCRGKVLTEASGGITLERIAVLCELGLDVISSGALTHSAPVADISLDLAVS